MGYDGFIRGKMMDSSMDENLIPTDESMGGEADDPNPSPRIYPWDTMDLSVGYDGFIRGKMMD